MTEKLLQACEVCWTHSWVPIPDDDPDAQKLLNQEGSTVFFSSHHLHDVERIADHIGILNDGEILLESTLDDLHEKYCRVVLPYNQETQEKLGQHKDCVSIKKIADSNSIIFSTNIDEAKSISNNILGNSNDFHGSQLNLEEVFIALAGESE